MAKGEILRTGAPLDLVSEMSGKLWRRVVPKDEAQSLRESVDVLGTRRVAGQIEVKVAADVSPPRFEAVEPTLEDVYFASLAEAGVDIDVA